MGVLLQDLRYAVRAMTRRPGLTLAALLTLAIGIGANTAMFGLIETVLINPLPYRDASRLVYLYMSDVNATTTPSPELIRACREQASSVEQIEHYGAQVFNLTGEGEPANLAGARVSSGFFSFLGVEPIVGRTFLPAESREGAHQVMLLSYGLWQSRFGADPQIVGRTLALDEEPYEVVGVLPPRFRLDAYHPIRFWIPQPDNLPLLESEDPGPLYAIARLRPDTTLTAAQAELDVISRQLERPDQGHAHGFGAGELQGSFMRPQDRFSRTLRTAILVLQGAVGFVLLIACANIANLLLAQGESRVKELALRSVLGAGRGRLVRQLLTESLLLSLLGGALGALLSLWGIERLVALLPQQLNRLDHVQLNATHLLFTLLVALVTGVLFGLIPALRGSSPDLNEALKQYTGSGGRRRVMLRQVLVGVEVALALVLLIGAGLLIRNFVTLQSVDPGFTTKNLLTVRLELPDKRYEEEELQVGFFHDLHDRLNRLPTDQVESVALTSGIGTGLGAIFAVPELEGGPGGDAERPREIIAVVAGTPGYFRTMGIPLLQGRGFGEQDREGAEPVLVINQSLARQLPAEQLVGRRLRFGETWHRIVGVAADVRLPMMGRDGVVKAMMFFPAEQSPNPHMTIAVRTTAAADPGPLVQMLKAQIWAIDPHVPVTSVATGRGLMAESMAQQNFNALLMALFAVIAAVLASVGVYGVVAYSVGQRTREIGIRIALGARRGEVLRHVVSHGMRPVFAGILIGLGAALALANVLASLLHGVSVRDPATFAGVTLLVALIALLATWWPARQGTRVDPAHALRHE